MSAQVEPIALRRGAVVARVLPHEGGVLVDLTIGGRRVLASAPWAGAVVPSASPAAHEDAWVRRWRGGWQLCFPTAGQPDPAATPGQSFHGVASQAAWTVLTADDAATTLRWADADGLSAERTWRLMDDGVAVTTIVEGGEAPRPVLVAEHLVLGGDVLGGPLTVDPGPCGVRALDYDGRPAGDPVRWPGAASERWTVVDERTPARMAALVDVEPRRIRIAGAHVDATVTWTGSALPHALLWEELGVSTDPPWDGAVRALGIEPTTAAHGAGTAVGEGAIALGPGDVVEWTVELHVEWTETA